jgi:hypothetical protein
LIDRAWELFKVNLWKIRKVVNVKIIYAHGSPLSPYSNQILREKYNYKKLGIIREPYLDIDWNEFGYLTDTGRRWNGDSVSVRDKVNRQLAVGKQIQNFQCSMFTIRKRSM